MTREFYEIPISVSAHNASLENRHLPLFIYYLLLLFQARVATWLVTTEAWRATKTKIFTIRPSTDTVHDENLNAEHYNEPLKRGLVHTTCSVNRVFISLQVIKVKLLRTQLCSSVLFGCCSVAQSCPTLWDPTECSTPGFPAHHHLPELAQIHALWVSDVIQPSRPLSSPSSPAFSLILFMTCKLHRPGLLNLSWH